MARSKPERYACRTGRQRLADGGSIPPDSTIYKGSDDLRALFLARDPRVFAPENAQFVCSRLAALAAGTGASGTVSYHFAPCEASMPEQARKAIRGTGGLVDGVRTVYALWHTKQEQAKAICKARSEPFERGRVVMGGGSRPTAALVRLHVRLRG